MYADRHGTQQLNPTSLTLSVGIVGGLVAAAMLSSTVIERIARDKPLIAYPVRETPPPAPLPPEVAKLEPRTTPRPAPPVDAPEIRVPTEAPTDSWVEPGPIAPVDFGAGSGNGTGGGAVIDPPKPPPVLVRADVDPRYLRDFQPVYPAAERRAGNEGVVTLKVLIGVDGRVREVERVAAPSDAFWRVTEDRARSKWRFTPATRDGVAYESWRTMTVRFRLED
jgi:protein TonB